MHHVLQISDCHLVTKGAELIGVDTQASLQAVLGKALAEFEADAIIASGDLAHDPARDVYQRFHQTIQQATLAPLLCLPGNHDVLGVMQGAGLPMTPVEIGGWHLNWLDSHEDELPRALITEADKNSLRERLAHTQAQHVLLATHHPLVAVNAPWLDKDRIQNPVELLQWCAKCCAQANPAGGDLRVVVFGHAHQAVSGQCAGIPVYGAPSTCFQFLPESEQFAVDTRPPGYRWLHLHDDGSVETEVGRVDDFAISVTLGR